MEDYKWLVPVLQDLRAYAQQHGLPATSQALNTALETAQEEIQKIDADSSDTRSKALRMRANFPYQVENLH